MRRYFSFLAIFFLMLSILGYLIFPMYLGSSVVPFFFALLSFAIYLPKNLRKDLKKLKDSKILLILSAYFCVLFFLIFLSYGNWFVNPKLFKWDVSPNRNWTLNQQSLEVIRKMPKGTIIEADLDVKKDSYFAVKELLNLYEQSSSITVVDVAQRSTLGLQKIKIESKKNNNVFEHASSLSSEMLKITTPDGCQATIIAPFSEKFLTTALNSCLRTRSDIVVFLLTEDSKIPHDSSRLGLSDLATSFYEYGLLTKTHIWDLANIEIPIEASMVFLIGPQNPIGPEREEVLTKYLKAGGRLFIMIDPLKNAVSSDFLKQFGLKMPQGVVVSPYSSFATNNIFLIKSNSYPYHDSIKDLRQPLAMLLAGAFLESEEAKLKHVLSSAIAESSAHEWLETNFESLSSPDTIKYNEKEDPKGPLALAVAVEIKNIKMPDGRLILSANSNFASNELISISGNLFFLISTSKWLIDDFSWIPSPPLKEKPIITLTDLNLRLSFYLLVVGLPSFLALFCFIYLFKRSQ